MPFNLMAASSSSVMPGGGVANCMTVEHQLQLMSQLAAHHQHQQQQRPAAVYPPVMDAAAIMAHQQQQQHAGPLHAASGYVHQHPQPLPVNSAPVRAQQPPQSQLRGIVL